MYVATASATRASRALRAPDQTAAPIPAPRPRRRRPGRRDRPFRASPQRVDRSRRGWSCRLSSADDRAIGGLDRIAHRPHGVVKTGPHGPVWNVKDLGDLAKREADEVMKDDHHPVVAAQPIERPAKLVAKGHLAAFVPARWDRLGE